LLLLLLPLLSSYRTEQFASFPEGGGDFDIMTPSNTPSAENNPLSAAREKLQSSARDLIRNIESAMGNKDRDRSSSETSLESAFRSLFTSCTTGASMNNADDDDEAEEEESQKVTPISSRRSSSLSSRGSPHQQQQSRTSKGTLRRLSSKLTERVAPPPPRTNSSPNFYASPSHQAVGEHVYAQLYLDGEQAAKRTPDKSPRRFSSPQLLGIQPNSMQKLAVSTKPFPKSSPVSSRPLSPTDGIAVPNEAFDDNISAISAHTLEAMAVRQPKLLVSHIPSTPSPRASSMKHHRSITPSTRTTQSSRSFDRSFEQWQNQEHQFWEAEVVVDTKKTNKKKKKSRKQIPSWRSHPHDTLPYGVREFHLTAPDDSETAEI